MKCSICEFESENKCEFNTPRYYSDRMLDFFGPGFDICWVCFFKALGVPVKEKIPLGSRRVAPDGTPEIYVKAADKESGRVEKTCDNCAERSYGRCPGHPAGVCGSWQAKAKVAEKQSDNKEKINAIKRLIVSPMEGVDTSKIKARAKELGVSDEEIAAWEEQTPRPIDGYQENYEIKAWERPLPPGYKVLSRETFAKETFEFKISKIDVDAHKPSIFSLEHFVIAELSITYGLVGKIEIGSAVNFNFATNEYVFHGTRTYRAGE